MRALLLTLFFLTAIGTQAASRVNIVKVEGLTIPFFDPAGRMTHKLTAKSGTLQGEDRVLHDAEELYFAADDSSKVVQRINAEEAVYSEKKQTLTGSGPLRVTTLASQLSGVGFDFSLGTSVLNLHRDVRMQDPEFVVTGDRGNAELVIEKTGDKLEYRGIRGAKFTGNLHLVTLKRGKKIRIEEAFTDVAIFDGFTRTITLPNELREIGRDEKGKKIETTSKRATIELSE